jgi:hypothetical protein
MTDTKTELTGESTSSNEVDLTREEAYHVPGMGTEKQYVDSNKERKLLWKFDV